MAAEIPARRRVCDLCHVRKVRCDRNDPCGNCVDQNTSCTRSRGMKRLPKRDLMMSRARSRDRQASGVSTPVSTVGAASVAAYGSLLDRSIGRSNDIDFVNVGFDFPTATATLDTSFLADILEDPGMLLDVEYELHSWMAIVPLTDAQMINRRRRIGHSHSNTNSQHLASWGRSQLLESALSVASQVLGSMEYSTETAGVVPPEEQRNVPSIEFLYWMLKDIGSPKFGPFISDYFRHISNPTLKHMGLSLLLTSTPATNPDSIIHTVCVNSVAYKFLTATLATEPDPDLAQSLRTNALAYRETAKAALQKIPLTTRPSLALLQAILCGIFLNQGSGDTRTCRELARTACRVCMDIGIGARMRTDLGSVSEEEYYCFMWCYTLDRNYAWKFGSVRVLVVDRGTDVDPPAAAAASQLMRIYLEFAKVQDAMIPYLDEPDRARGDERFQFGRFLLDRMEGVRGDIDQIKPPSPDWRGLDATSEIATLDFAYHSILTNLLHLRQISLGHVAGTATSIPTSVAGAAMDLGAGAGAGPYSTPSQPQPQTETAIYLDSARRNLLALIRICASSDEQKTVAYLHWTILYYPITASIALLCNAIATGHEGDVEILRAVSNSLAQSGALSAPIAAMRRLLVEFVRLCRGGSVVGDNPSSAFGVDGGDDGMVANANANVGRSMQAGTGVGNADGSVLPVTDSVSMLVSPWAGASGSQDGLGLGVGMEMGLGLAVSTVEPQMEGMATMAGVDFMGHDETVFSF
ncbi:hypothetical protein ASPCAL03763 [Aspergillus calidoustus]|uniref:Zn(2)-C6 fungal-type domain-containing protein n=1 Tax=Aspergillus calidoustus TaxID=454130 RepID=A0A0U5GP84_ASPCI|nr:hypothetical protein ASPCAL03763 [Aspergillus calidoustus]